ncbi:dipeptide ABC transporter ATP-binding protein [Kluyvera sichuanensis]|uniref:ABC-type dipeptide transporter n=1 Tax=Kluyvera sichuanensis TaxID=2725494 RepID=A0ABR6RNI9_9ENTR|nr:dipeptide ABC transporter ATP-binding protein [Kluyvera sichuanensis]MBC1184692.1 ABC transporter ATP-binding protein [Kluyvera sichuanensis]
MSLLTLSHLNVLFHQQNVQAVDDISLTIAPGEVLALAGESGSGKSVTAAAILGLLPASQVTVSGSITFDGQPLLHQSTTRLNRLRGHEIAMVFQNSLSTLDPSWRIGKQLQHNLKRLHPELGRTALREAALAWLTRMKIGEPEQVMSRFPHQLSGGMRQRVLIALAAMCRPRLLIADEPTTALDATVQREVLQLLKALCQQQQMAMLIITHDFGVVAELSDRVAVMRQGKIIESNATKALIAAPQHPYTQSLLAAVPYPSADPVLTPRAEGTPLLQACNLGRDFWRRETAGWWPKKVATTVVDGVNLDVARGEIVGIIGESGSGKSTLARLLAQLIPANRGELRLAGNVVDDSHPASVAALRRQLQCVFQDSLASFNPRLTLEEQLVRPQFRLGTVADRPQAIARAAALFAEVGLDTALLQRFPHQLSGGQRQRANIARALVVNPSILLLDEPTSALDLTVQAQVMTLLTRMHQQHALTCLFISHNLALVSQFCQRIVVMAHGVVVDDFARHELYAADRHPVTQQLLDANYLLPSGNADTALKRFA